MENIIDQYRAQLYRDFCYTATFCTQEAWAGEVWILFVDVVSGDDIVDVNHRL